MIVLAMALLLACRPDPTAQQDSPAEPCAYECLEAEPQRSGDAARGYAEVVDGDYITCGIPWDLYTFAFGQPDESELIPDRTGRNAEIPYYFTSHTTDAGVEVIASNCLTCHAGRIAGEVVVGLGAADWDFTQDAGRLASLARQYGPSFLSDDAAIAELDRWAERVETTAPYLVTSTLGQNPANNLFAVLSAHRGQDDLAWSTEPLLEPPALTPPPTDVPPWWHMRKKSAMFWSGTGRGDHARIEMTASLLCTDSLSDAEGLDARFVDVNAWLGSLVPPAYPFAIDTERAEEGRVVFEATCSRCHGTYGEDWTYQTVLVPLDVIGTDPVLAEGTHYAARFTDWFNGSFFGELSRLEPHVGYVAPPLDGIWATAPYLHNGSVPTVWDVLSSAGRPVYWTRSYDSRDLDTDHLGWNHTALDEGQDMAAEPERVTDTTLPGGSNAGHTFGDELTDDERWAVIEYLKTL